MDISTIPWQHGFGYNIFCSLYVYLNILYILYTFIAIIIVIIVKNLYFIDKFIVTNLWWHFDNEWMSHQRIWRIIFNKNGGCLFPVARYTKFSWMLLLCHALFCHDGAMSVDLLGIRCGLVWFGFYVVLVTEVKHKFAFGKYFVL